VLPPRHARALAEFQAALVRELGDNVQTLSLYGSAVAGGFDARHAALNVLIVLGVASDHAHAAIGDAVAFSLVKIEPFVLDRQGLRDSAHAFAAQLADIRGAQHVLHGTDLLTEIDVDPDAGRLHIEQWLRAARMRSVLAFISSRRERTAYIDFVLQLLPELIGQLSAALRRDGTDVPERWTERLPLIGGEFGCDTTVLAQLLHVRDVPQRLSASTTLDVHRTLLDLLDRCLHRVAVTSAAAAGG
jgi:hypothetical protein